MAATAPAPAPPPPRNRRLGSLKNASLTGSLKGPPTKSATTGAASARQHTCCDSPKVEDDGEGRLVCQNCFTQISEANIVSDVTFQEDSRGAAAVQGGFIAENARHASTLGSAITRATGAGERNAAQEQQRNARRALDKFCPTLGIPDTTRDQAVMLFCLASRSSFSSGRRTDEVAAACLYAACRRQRGNQIMLVDLSELLQINVFRLGEVYKAMCQDLHLNEHGGVGTQYLVEVESLIMKYCRKLEFGDLTRQVADDAVKILRRMKRDWMVSGRHPAGLCSACILLAARMNNFRRSIREIVWVAKIADITVYKRVQEFRRTKASKLTVEQFREYGVRLNYDAAPPVLRETELKARKMTETKRKRQESMARATTIESSVGPDESNGSDESNSDAGDDDNGRSKRRRTENGALLTPPATQQQEVRRDADGFAIPSLPTSVAANGQPQTAQESPKRGRGRPKKVAMEPVIISEEELAVEESLQFDINDHLNDDDLLESRNEEEKLKDQKRAQHLATQEKMRSAEETRVRREAEGIRFMNMDKEVYTAEDLEAEFANDEEVERCIMTEEERKGKEQIWVSHNEDWLRSQQERMLHAAIAKAHAKDGKGGQRKPTKRKRKAKIGDGTLLAEATTPVETPADANRIMLEKHNPKMTKYLDWTKVGVMYDGQTPLGSERGSVTPAPDSSADSSPRSAKPPLNQRISVSPAPSLPRARSASVDLLAARDPTPGLGGGTPQPQAGAGAEDEVMSDPDDYVQDDQLDYGSDGEWGEEEREDIGEEDFHRAVASGGRVNFEGEYQDLEF